MARNERSRFASPPALGLHARFNSQPHCRLPGQCVALAGDRQESLVNAIGRDNSKKRNTALILLSPQGNPPSFYGVHPPEADGKSSWFPMDPHDKNIPTEYRQGWNYRLGGDWGDEPQYDSDEE